MKGNIIFLGLKLLFFLLIVIYVLYSILQFKFNSSIAILGILTISMFNLIYWPVYFEYKKKEHLKSYGKWTFGKVIDINYLSTRRGSGWQIKIEYRSSNLICYTEWEHIGYIEKYQKGDSLKINHSEEYPKLYMIEDDWY